MSVSAEKDIAISFVQEIDVGVNEIAMNIALCLVYCFFVFSATASDGATRGRGKSGKGGGIGPGASPMSIVGRLFLLLFFLCRRPTAHIKKAVYLLRRLVVSLVVVDIDWH